MKTVLLFVLLLAVQVAGATSGAMDKSSEASVPAKPVRAVLLGASIGQAWNLPELPKRLHDDRFVFEALQAWQYDKSELVEETLMRPARKFRLTPSYLKGFFEPSPQPPELIILKECSSYFPGVLADKKGLYESWVRKVKEKKIRVVVATVVPVTRERSQKDPGKQQAVREFNDWLRDFAHRESLPLLDLELAVRTDEKERYLRDDLTSGDGSHLNAKAYAILDRVMLDTLCGVEPACSRNATAGLP